MYHVILANSAHPLIFTANQIKDIVTASGGQMRIENGKIHIQASLTQMYLIIEALRPSAELIQKGAPVFITEQRKNMMSRSCDIVRDLLQSGRKIPSRIELVIPREDMISTVTTAAVESLPKTSAPALEISQFHRIKPKQKIGKHSNKKLAPGMIYFKIDISWYKLSERELSIRLKKRVEHILNTDIKEYILNNIQDVGQPDSIITKFSSRDPKKIEQEVCEQILRERDFPANENLINALSFAINDERFDLNSLAYLNVHKDDHPMQKTLKINFQGNSFPERYYWVILGNNTYKWEARNRYNSAGY